MPGTTIRHAPEAQTGAFTAPSAFDLYRQLLETPGNLSFSPFGIASALVMAQAGAAGTTRREIEAVLHREGAGERLVEQTGELSRELRALADSEDEAIHLSVASALWAQSGYPLHLSFIERLREGLDAEAREVDFARHPAEAVRAVNAWVADATGDRITSILSEDQVDSLTRGVLANAIYLKAPWARSFMVWKTRPLPFHLADGTRIEVPTMYQGEGFGYRRTKGLQIIRLDYRNRRVSMLVLLPDPGQLERVEQELDSSRLDDLESSLKMRDIHLFLPRFRVDSSFTLRSVLERLGMRSAFGPGADFSGVSSEPGFQIGEVTHKTFVSVDESGTEAAGATVNTLLGGIPDPDVEVRVDRPFLFLIRHEDTGTVLFIGRVTDPRIQGWRRRRGAD